MRELLLTLRFTSPSLGNVKKYVRQENSAVSWPVFYMPRSLDGRVRFETNWWKSGLVFAADILCRHQKDVRNVEFAAELEGRTNTDIRHFFKRFLPTATGRSRFVRHEAFLPDDVVRASCVVPDVISDEAFEQLMQYFGRFRGISPFRPKQYGHFQVEKIQEQA